MQERVTNHNTNEKNGMQSASVRLRLDMLTDLEGDEEDISRRVASARGANINTCFDNVTRSGSVFAATLRQSVLEGPAFRDRIEEEHG